MSKPGKRQAGKMIQAVLQSLLRKPATINYPKIASPMPDRFRGRLLFFPERCTGCKLCVRDCPAGAIQINRISKTEIECEIDLAKCIYCGQCVDSCPRKALEITGDYELAQIDRQKLKIIYKPKPKPDAETESPGSSPDAENKTQGR